MNSLASIIQLISSAVSAKMTLKLSERIGQMMMQKGSGSGSGWVDRTRAGRAIQEQKIGRTGKNVDYARSANETAKQASINADRDHLAEQANPTGKSLDDLAKAAEKAKKAFEETSFSLTRAIREHDRVRAAAISKPDMRRVEHVANSVDYASERKKEVKGKLSTVQQAIDSERSNPTGMSTDDLELLEAAAVYLRTQFDTAAESLTKLTREQDQLRESLDKQFRSRQYTPEEDVQRVSQSASDVLSATSERDDIAKRLDAIADEFAKSAFDPNGISDKELERLDKAANKLRDDFDKASKSVEKLTKEHNQNVEDANKHSRANSSALDRGSKNAEQADEKNPQKTSFVDKWLRKGREGISYLNRKIGSKGRKLTKGLTKARKNVQEFFDRRDPVKVNKGIATAKTRHVEAQEKHASNLEAHKLNPTAETAGAI